MENDYSNFDQLLGLCIVLRKIKNNLLSDDCFRYTVAVLILLHDFVKAVY